MNALIVSDLHFTSNPRDAYRWGLFDWLIEQMQGNRVQWLFILGDLTEAKDYHSSRLVNKIVDNLVRCREQASLTGIKILRGNHDGLDPECSYFKFLSRFPEIQFIDTPWMQEFAGHKVQFLPHTKDPAAKWRDLDFIEADLVLMHATVEGAKSETGFGLSGVPVGLLRKAHRAKVYSGDVHVPQIVGPVEYIGAPYPIRFGDDFIGRAVLLEDFKRPRDLHFDTIQRLVLTVVPSEERVVWPGPVAPGDQVKVKIRLAPHEYVDWHRMRQNAIKACEEAGVELCGIELERVPEKKPLVKRAQPQVSTAPVAPGQILSRFCSDNKINDEVSAAGRDILEFLGKGNAKTTQTLQSGGREG